MKQATPEKQTHHPLPMLFYERPRCAHCESVRLEVRRTIQQGDDSLLRYVRCRACGQSSKIILE